MSGDIARIENAISMIGKRIDILDKSITEKLEKQSNEITKLAGDVKFSNEYKELIKKDLYDPPREVLPTVEKHKFWILNHEEEHQRNEIRHEKEVNRHRYNITTIVAILALVATCIAMILNR